MCAMSPSPAALPSNEPDAVEAASAHAIIPAPLSWVSLPGEQFELTATSRIVVVSHDPAVAPVAERFAGWLRRPTGYAVPVAGGEATDDDIAISVAPSSEQGAEGYTLRVGSSGVHIGASTPAGVFRALTTLRQLLPAAAEATAVQPGPWKIDGADITDRPRFEYRGTMLDVARHFFGVDDVLRHIDLISLYKVNVLHLHLTDDQGWRLTVPGWPLLTEIGGAGDIDGGPGGYFTAEDYARIVAYAAERFIEVVPEIDGPGHASAALISYPELNCDGMAPPPFHHGGISEVTLCASADSTYDFLGDVFDALAAEPGRYVHIGGDEAIGTPHDDFMEFVPRAAGLVVERGRTPVMWHEAAQATLPAGSVVQYWGVGQDEATELARRAAAQGARLILSPANHAYLDMKYDDDDAARSGVGRRGPCQPVVRLGAGGVDRRHRRGVDPRGRVGVVVRDYGRPWCRRVPGVPATCRHRRDRVVADRGAGVGRLPPAPGRPRSAVGRPRRQLLQISRGPLASVTVS